MHLVRVATKANLKRKDKTTEHQLCWSSPEPLTLTREPWHQSSTGPTSKCIHPPRQPAEQLQPSPQPWASLVDAQTPALCSIFVLN